MKINKKQKEDFNQPSQLVESLDYVYEGESVILRLNENYIATYSTECSYKLN